MHELMAFDLSTTDVTKIRRTGALLDQKIEHMDTVDKWLFERLRDGALFPSHREWTDAAPSKLIFQDYNAHARDTGRSLRQIETEVGKRLRRLPGHSEQGEGDLPPPHRTLRPRRGRDHREAAGAGIPAAAADGVPRGLRQDAWPGRAVAGGRA